jgi:hypothetical protein
MEKNYGVFPPYNQAKLMNCLFTVQLAKKFGRISVVLYIDIFIVYMYILNDNF